MKYEILGLFPNISLERFGGVELSGRLAWQAIQEYSVPRKMATQLFCYVPGATHAENINEIIVRSKFAAARILLTRAFAPRVILVWHLGLLKLLPFVRVPRARVIVFLHGIEAWRAQDVLTRRLFARVSLFLANSEFTWSRFLEYAPQLKNHSHCVLPLGAGEPMQEWTAPAPNPIALMVSRLERSENYKGHREMIAAWRAVREKIPRAELWIAGDGDLRADLEIHARENQVAGAVRFLGRVSESEKQNLLKQCCCFVMPSRGEGFGLAYVEAMRAGRPCLVSTLDAGMQVVNPPEAGLAVNPMNTAALVDAACRLLAQDDEWTHMARAAQTRYAENFTAAQFQQRLLDALTAR